MTILATEVDNWTMDNLRIDTNRDGVDIDACQNVRMSNCSINAPYDDAICLKSSYGLGCVRMTENVTITNCLVSGYDEGSLLDDTRTRLVRAYTEKRAARPSGAAEFSPSVTEVRPEAHRDALDQRHVGDEAFAPPLEGRAGSALVVAPAVIRPHCEHVAARRHNFRPCVADRSGGTTSKTTGVRNRSRTERMPAVEKYFL